MKKKLIIGFLAIIIAWYLTLLFLPNITSCGVSASQSAAFSSLKTLQIEYQKDPSKLNNSIFYHNKGLIQSKGQYIITKSDDLLIATPRIRKESRSSLFEKIMLLDFSNRINQELRIPLPSGNIQYGKVNETQGC